MAIFNDIEIKSEVRPCFINEKKALFHLWIRKYDYIMKNEYIEGLVEFGDGTVREILAKEIRFCDYKIREYSFKESE